MIRVSNILRLCASFITGEITKAEFVEGVKHEIKKFEERD